MKRRESGERIRRRGEERKEENERGIKRIQVILPKADRE